MSKLTLTQSLDAGLAADIFYDPQLSEDFYENNNCPHEQQLTAFQEAVQQTIHIFNELNDLAAKATELEADEVIRQITLLNASANSQNIDWPEQK